MGWNFRKSVKILPGVKVNIGKNGVSSVTVGGKVARTTIGKNGKVTQSVSIPGTGISYRETVKEGTTSKANNKKPSAARKSVSGGTAPYAPPPVARAVSPIISSGSPNANKDRSDRQYFHSIYNGAVKVYQYSNAKIAPRGNFPLAMGDMEASGNWNVELILENDKVYFTYKKTKIGTLVDRADMVKDFLSRGDAVLARLDPETPTEPSLLLAFYRDERKRLSHRENEVVKLIRYANQEAQDFMIGLEPGYQLDFDPNYDYNAPEDTVFILCGGAIGALPKKQSRRYLSESAAGVFVEKIEYDTDKGKDIPYVRIFW